MLKSRKVTFLVITENYYQKNRKKITFYHVVIKFKKSGGSEGTRTLDLSRDRRSL